MTTHTENKLESLTFGNETTVFARQSECHHRCPVGIYMLQVEDGADVLQIYRAGYQGAWNRNFSSYGTLHLLYFATPTTFYDDSFVFIYAGNYRLRLPGRRRQLMAKSDHIHTMHCSSSSLNEFIADLRLQLVLDRARRAFSHRYDNPPSSRQISMMNGTGLRQYTQVAVHDGYAILWQA